MPRNARTHCKRGHALIGNNIIIKTNGSRGCRSCTQIRVRRWRLKNRPNKTAHPENAAKTHCIHGHPFSGKNLIVQGKRRRCRTCLNHTRSRSTPNLSPERIDRIFNYLKDGGTSYQMKFGPVAKLYFQSHPDLLNQANEMLSKNRTFIRSKLPVLRKLPALIVRSGPTSNASEAGLLLNRINQLVPRNLSRDMRHDIISDIVLAIIEGKILENDVSKNISRFVNRSFREDHNKFGFVSLDTPVSDTGSLLREFIREDQRLWA